MRSLVNLIQRHAQSDEDFLYYIPIIEEAEENEVGYPDITIECCASLLQGVSKTICHRLDPNCDRKALEVETLPKQVRQAFNWLKWHDDVIEDEFARAAENLSRILGSLRNARGDISHGRIVPKELQSDRSLSRLALGVTEAVLRYMLASYFSIRTEPLSVLVYDAMPISTSTWMPSIPWKVSLCTARRCSISTAKTMKFSCEHTGICRPKARSADSGTDEMGEYGEALGAVPTDCCRDLLPSEVRQVHSRSFTPGRAPAVPHDS